MEKGKDFVNVQYNKPLSQDIKLSKFKFIIHISMCVLNATMCCM